MNKPFTPELDGTQASFSKQKRQYLKSSNPLEASTIFIV